MYSRAELQKKREVQRSHSQKSNAQNAKLQRQQQHYAYQRHKNIQAQLISSDSKAKYEEEADKVAESLASGKTTSPITPLIGNSGGVNVNSEVSSKLQSESGKGSPLPDGVKSKFESGLNTDLSDVRVHTDSTANDLSQSLQAKALTYGKDIYFNEGEYKPGTEEGDKLLAHEVTHTVQQTESKEVQRKEQDTGNLKDILNPIGAFVDFIFDITPEIVGRAFHISPPPLEGKSESSIDKMLRTAVEGAVKTAKVATNPLGEGTGIVYDKLADTFDSKTPEDQKMLEDRYKGVRRTLPLSKAINVSLQKAFKDYISSSGTKYVSGKLGVGNEESESIISSIIGKFLESLSGFDENQTEFLTNPNVTVGEFLKKGGEIFEEYKRLREKVSQSEETNDRNKVTKEFFRKRKR